MDRHAVLGNAGTVISLRAPPEDATYLSQEFQRSFAAQDLINLPNRSM